MEEKILINKSIVVDLLRDSIILGALDAARVDKWPSYEDALRRRFADVGVLEEMVQEDLANLLDA